MNGPLFPEPDRKDRRGGWQQRQNLSSAHAAVQDGGDTPDVPRCQSGA